MGRRLEEVSTQALVFYDKYIEQNRKHLFVMRQWGKIKSNRKVSFEIATKISFVFKDYISGIFRLSMKAC